jgi:putative transposase
MARLRRICLAGLPRNVIQRGDNRAVCSGAEGDFAGYAHWLEEKAREYDGAVHAWVFMTNHVHLLLTPEDSDSVSKMMQSLGRRYVRYFNHCYRRSDTLRRVIQVMRWWMRTAIYLYVSDT